MGKLNSIPPLGNPVTKRGILAALAKAGVPQVTRAASGTPNSEPINSVADALVALGLASAITLLATEFTLTNVTDTDGVIEKTAATYAWDAKAQAGPYTGDMTFSVQPTNTGSDAWVGFATADTAFANTDPNIAGAVYYINNTNSRPYAGGTTDGTELGPYVATSNDQFRRAGDELIFSRDGVDLWTWSIPAATPLYFVIALAVQNAEVTFVRATQP